MHKKPEGVTYRLPDPDPDLLYALIFLGVMAVSTCCLVLLLLGLL
jgi:hypothetical protein